MFTFTFINLSDAFIQSDLQLWNTSSSSSQRGKQTQKVLLKPNFRHCSNKYKLDRERLKEREKGFFSNSDEKHEFSAIT